MDCDTSDAGFGGDCGIDGPSFPDPVIDVHASAEEAERADAQTLVILLLASMIPVLFVVILLGRLVPALPWSALLLLPFLAAIVAPHWLRWRSDRPILVNGTLIRGVAHRRFILAGAIAALVLWTIALFAQGSLMWLAEWLAQFLSGW